MGVIPAFESNEKNQSESKFTLKNSISKFNFILKLRIKNIILLKKNKLKDFLKKMENLIINEHKKNKIGLFSQKVYL